MFKTILITIFLSLFPIAVFADSTLPIQCTNFSKTIKTLIHPEIQRLDANFNLQSKDCNIIETSALFPKTKNHYEKGLTLFIYQNRSLKFICLPGWHCNSWNSKA